MGPDEDDVFVESVAIVLVSVGSVSVRPVAVELVRMTLVRIIEVVGYTRSGTSELVNVE